MQGHEGFVWSVVHSPKVKSWQLAVWDYSIRLLGCRYMSRSLNHASPVVSVIYSPDGQSWVLWR